MSKIIIVVGLPGSGKSTKAEEIMMRDGNAVRINRDLLREMFHCGKWTGVNEGRTKDAARCLAEMFLKKGVNVIIDDTNLSEKTVQSWVDLARDIARIEYVVMDTSIEECIRRDALRERQVGRTIILEMAMNAGIWKPKNEKGIIIVDIDGTIADCEYRKHYLLGEKKDWDSFYAGIEQDLPRLDIMAQVDEYRKKGHSIVLVSGRPYDYCDATENWLDRHNFNYDALLMRKTNDKRPDTDIKKEIYDKCLKKYKIECVFDDRPRIIKMWKDQGLKVFDVGKGIDF